MLLGRVTGVPTNPTASVYLAAFRDLSGAGNYSMVRYTNVTSLLLAEAGPQAQGIYVSHGYLAFDSIGRTVLGFGYLFAGDITYNNATGVTTYQRVRDGLVVYDVVSSASVQPAVIAVLNGTLGAANINGSSTVINPSPGVAVDPTDNTILVSNELTLRRLAAFPQSAATVSGDPSFCGLRGQLFQVHGLDGGVYNLISDAAFNLNSRFTFLLL